MLAHTLCANNMGQTVQNESLSGLSDAVCAAILWLKWKARFEEDCNKQKSIKSNLIYTIQLE